MLHADHVRLHEDFSGLNGLPANRAALIQRVSRTGRALLLHDGLKTAALNIGDAVGVLTEEQVEKFIRLADEYSIE